MGISVLLLRVSGELVIERENNQSTTITFLFRILLTVSVLSECQVKIYQACMTKKGKKNPFILLQNNEMQIYKNGTLGSRKQNTFQCTHPVLT